MFDLKLCVSLMLMETRERKEGKKEEIICHMKFVSVAVFPNVPPAPGMPCQGEDSEFSSSKQNSLTLHYLHTIFTIQRFSTL